MSYFKNDQELKKYLSDDIKLDFIKRSYLLNVSIKLIFQVIFAIRRDIYNELYMKYKIIKNSRETEKWNSYYINVTQATSNGISEYSSLGG